VESRPIKVWLSHLFKIEPVIDETVYNNKLKQEFKEKKRKK